MAEADDDVVHDQGVATGAEDEPVAHACVNPSAMLTPYRWPQWAGRDERVTGHDLAEGARRHPGQRRLEGVAGKNIRLLAGLPLIAHSIRAAALMTPVTRCVISTDDPSIAGWRSPRG